MTSRLIPLLFLTVSPCFAGVTEDLAQAAELSKANQNEEALQLYQKILTTYPDNEADTLTALKAIVAIQQTKLKQTDEAIKTYESIVAKFPDNAVECGTALSSIAAIYKAEGNTAKTIEYLEKACAKSPEHTSCRAWLKDLGTIYRDQGDAAKALLRFRQIVVVDPTDATNALPAQMEVVKTVLHDGQYQEALGEAKVYFGLCSHTATLCPAAMQLVAQCLKARDGHLFSGDAFYKFQKFGPNGEDKKPGTEDDLSNPLAAVSLYGDAPRAELYGKAIERTPKDLPGLRLRGFYYLYLGDPVKALNELRQAFEQCDMANTALEAAARDVVVAFNSKDAYVLAGGPWLMYQKHGQAGPDGKKGTPDDLEDPLANPTEKPIPEKPNTAPPPKKDPAKPAKEG